MSAETHICKFVYLFVIIDIFCKKKNKKNHFLYMKIDEESEMYNNNVLWRIIPKVIFGFSDSGISSG